MRVEPDLQPITDKIMTAATANTSDGARLDIAMNGFWGGNFERTFVDVRMFNPYAPSNRNSTISTCYRNHENQKKRAYDQRIRVVARTCNIYTFGFVSHRWFGKADSCFL